MKVDAAEFELATKSGLDAEVTARTNADSALSLNKISGDNASEASHVTNIHYGTGDGGFLNVFTKDGAPAHRFEQSVVKNASPEPYAISFRWVNSGGWKLFARVNETDVWNHIDGALPPP